MVTVSLLKQIIDELNKRKRYILENAEDIIPPHLFHRVRRKILRELGKDEFEKNIERIIEEYERSKGKGK